MTENDLHPSEQAAPCGCFAMPHQFLASEKELGMDDHYAEVTLLVCTLCAQHWLKYFFEIEAFPASGRWYLGAVTAKQAARLTAANAKAALEKLDWYFYGGSYYHGRSGRTSGRIMLNP
jgi:hypothetical protein